MDGPICRSANQLAAMGAPAPIISSAMMIRSMPGRPPPPCSTGHVIPMNPSAASTLENSLEWPLIHESWNRPYSATPCSATARARARSSSHSGRMAKSRLTAAGLPAPAVTRRDPSKAAGCYASGQLFEPPQTTRGSCLSLSMKGSRSTVASWGRAVVVVQP